MSIIYSVSNSVCRSSVYITASIIDILQNISFLVQSIKYCYTTWYRSINDNYNLFIPQYCHITIKRKRYLVHASDTLFLLKRVYTENKIML